jgi:hypothetical protein
MCFFFVRGGGGEGTGRLAEVVGFCRESVVPERLRKLCYIALNGKHVLYNIVTCMYMSCFWHYLIFGCRSRGKKLRKYQNRRSHDEGSSWHFKAMLFLPALILFRIVSSAGA